MKRQLLLLVLVLMTAGVWAQQISEEQARDRALKFLTNTAVAKTRGLNVGMDRRRLRLRRMPRASMPSTWMAAAL